MPTADIAHSGRTWRNALVRCRPRAGGTLDLRPWDRCTKLKARCLRGSWRVFVDAPNQRWRRPLEVRPNSRSMQTDLSPNSFPDVGKFIRCSAILDSLAFADNRSIASRLAT